MVSEENNPHQGHDEEFIDVVVATTSGHFPSEGFNRVPIHQVIQVYLDRAAKALGLTDTTNWVVSVDKKPINAGVSYKDNGLCGHIEIDWGPSEGGGGHA